MRLKYIDYPNEILAIEYERLKKKLVDELQKNESILSIYQMGSVRHPGISDLDIICVFKNDSNCQENFRLNLNLQEKNILTHGLFGIEERDIITGMSYNLISNLKLLGGKDLNLDTLEISTDMSLKKQIALEYLVKMLITLDIQLKFKIIKLRAFLLLAKAIEFDLQLLDVKEGELYELVQKVIQYRGRWYTKTPNQKQITELVLNFSKSLKSFLEKELVNSNLFLPKEELVLPGNTLMQKADTFSVIHKGLVLPNQFSFLGRKYINLQNRLNQFIYLIPFQIPVEGSLHDRRFQFSKKMYSINKLNYPYFIPLTTSLSIYN